MSSDIPEQAILPMNDSPRYGERVKSSSIRRRRRQRALVGLVGLLLVGFLLLSIGLVKNLAIFSSSSTNDVGPEAHQPNFGCVGLQCDTIEEDVFQKSPTMQPALAIPSPTTTESPSLVAESPSILANATSVATASPSTVSATATHAPSLNTAFPSNLPTHRPSFRPTSQPTRINFNPGELTVLENDLLLSTGLTAKLLATTGEFVTYANGGQSLQTFHKLPDFGATFPDPENPGGWIYVSNSEVRQYEGTGMGGVGSFTFDAKGNLVDYKRVLNGTTANCGGGRTPWNAWISCEEYNDGRVWQVDPVGLRAPEVITLGSDGGVFESFAYDIRNPLDPAFFVTEDHLEGALQRFRPDFPNWDDPWSILLGSGTTDFLVLTPDTSGATGAFQWTTDREQAKASAKAYYPNSEGIDVYEGDLYFISKRHKTMITLDLDNGTYKNETTKNGLFNGGPDQIKRILNDDSNLLFFTEDGGRYAGIHARNENGDYLTILESPTHFPETTGLSFSPDGKAMYIAYQGDGSEQALEENKVGYLYEIRREDGLPFNGRSLNVNYHA